MTIYQYINHTITHHNPMIYHISHITDCILCSISQTIIHRSVCLSVYLSIYPSIHLSIYPSTYQSIYLSVYPSLFHSIHAVKKHQVWFFESQKISGLGDDWQNKLLAFLPSPNDDCFFVLRHWLHRAAICAISRRMMVASNQG